jgi:hypothetical protein
MQGLGQSATVQLSALEIYCERVRDLLADAGAGGGGGDDGGGVGGVECELITVDTRTVVRHKRDRSPLVECTAATVAGAMATLSGALQSRTVRATRCGAPPARMHCMHARPRAPSHRPCVQEERQVEPLALARGGVHCESCTACEGGAAAAAQACDALARGPLWLRGL